MALKNFQKKNNEKLSIHRCFGVDRNYRFVNGNLESIETTMIEAERKETEDLEKWIESNPEILVQDIVIIGKQVPIKTGRIDLLGIDKSGNLVIVELKRGKESA